MSRSPVDGRKRSQATHIAPTPSKPSQRPSLETLEHFKKELFYLQYCASRYRGSDDIVRVIAKARDELDEIKTRKE